MLLYVQKTRDTMKCEQLQIPKTRAESTEVQSIRRTGKLWVGLVPGSWDFLAYEFLNWSTWTHFFSSKIFWFADLIIVSYWLHVYCPIIFIPESCDEEDIPWNKRNPAFMIFTYTVTTWYFFFSWYTFILFLEILTTKSDRFNMIGYWKIH